MCGITGFFSNKEDFNPERFARANNIIRHRGPDDFGYISLTRDFKISIHKDEWLRDFRNGNILGAMGFRRLSIIDLSPMGNQPMTEITGEIWIVFNGEIYNYIELRQDLEKKGFLFRSQTDTEVVLNAYKCWGIDCVTRFNGMWSFCILDLREHKIFCSRDRMGIKPFYFISDQNCFAFASEIKQLLELFPDKFNKINKRLAFDFLALGSYGNETRETYFEGILKVDPGCILELNLDDALFKPKVEKFWNLPEYNPSLRFNDKEVFCTVKDLIESSIKLRLRSDVPVATAFSGGLDSSGIVCMLNEIYNRDRTSNKVFTISSNDRTIDDTYFADLLINKIPVTSFRENFEENVSFRDLEKFVWHQEEPLQNTSIYGSWQLYKFIKSNGITVVLDGQGADELMGGYNRYPFRKYLIDIFINNKLSYYVDQTKHISSIYGKNLSEIFYNTLVSLIIERIKSQFPDLYVSNRISDIKSFFNKSFLEIHQPLTEVVRRSYVKESSFGNNILKEESYNLTKHSNLPGILRQVDRNSMAFSIESRLPFLDYRLVEYLFSLPSAFIIRNGYTKYAYRKSMEGLIPEEVLWRKTKVGFKMPEYELMKKNIDYVKRILNDDLAEDYLNRHYIVQNLGRLLSQPEYYNNIIWRMMIFSVWKNKFRLI
jgi:asparagine synthase (glutamine-hydrolysing)